MRGASRPRTAGLVLGASLLPAALLLRAAAFRFPELTERLYGQRVYPWINSGLSSLNRWLPFSLAETLIGLALIGGVVLLFKGLSRLRRLRTTLGKAEWLRGVLVVGLALWIAGGVISLGFLLAWGLNYARPSVQQRLALDVTDIDAEEVLDLGRRVATAASGTYVILGADALEPTTMPLDFAELDAAIDASLDAIGVPGYPSPAAPSPAKRLFASTLLAHLGISGIYIPFTGEPSVNGLVPDASLPLTVAHEKAHQRGVTDEGEASLVAFMACIRSDEPYIRYAANLFAASRLIGGAARYLPEEARSAWELLGPGPLRDLRAIRDFWAAYEGRASRVAGRVNDAYLRSNRVRGGIQSYGRIVQLLVALDRGGARPAQP